MAALPAPRPLASADLDAVTRIEREIFPDPWSKRAFAESLAREDVRGWAQDGVDGRLIGYGLCVRAADEGEILNLAVDPRSRRLGAGRTLLEAMLDWLRGGGVGRGGKGDGDDAGWLSG